jgi:hypothetical protein
VKTIQLTAQVDDNGVLRVQMPDGLRNTTVEATIVFTQTGDRSKLPSPSNTMAEDRTAWTELVYSLSGAWAEDFPSLNNIHEHSTRRFD